MDRPNPVLLSRRAMLKGTVVSGASLLLVACGSPPAPATQAPADASAPEASGAVTAGGSPAALSTGDIRWGIAEEPDTLDAQMTPRAISFAVLNYLGGSLIYKDFDGNYVPGLATSWDTASDGKQLTFQLRPGVTFHDGTPFDAATLKYTFDRGLDPATKSPIFPSLVGPVERTEVVDPMTFRIVLSEPYGPLLENFAVRGTSWLQPLSPNAVNAAAGDYGHRPVSTGPWKFGEWSATEAIMLERNMDYTWAPPFAQNQGPVGASRLVIRIVPEDNSRVAALEAGELDFADIPPSAVAQFEQNADFTLFQNMRKGTGLTIHFNFQHPPLDDVRVRQALHVAIDRDAMVKAVLDGRGEPAYGPLPPSLPFYWSGVKEIGYGYDPEQASQLLENAGWTPGDDGMRVKDGTPLRLTILTPTQDEYQRAAQLIKEQYRQVGIDLNLETREIGAINPLLFAHNFELSFMWWIDHDPDILFREFHSSQITDGANWGSLNDPALDELLVAGRTAMDPDARAKAYQAVQEYFVKQALWIPIYNVYQYTAINNRVTGAKWHPDGYVFLQDAHIA